MQLHAVSQSACSKAVRPHVTSSCRPSQPCRSSRSQGTAAGHKLQQRQRSQQHVCQGFLGTLFGGSTQQQQQQEQQKHLEDDLGEEQDEIVLVTTERPDGTSARIVFRNGSFEDAAALEKLCEKVGWPSRSVQKVQLALRNSYLVSTLHLQISKAPADGSNANGNGSSNANGSSSSSSNGQQQERLIGLGRATSDHAFNATIWDVLVDPEFQGQGLGKALVEHMVRTLLRRDITNIALFADSKVVDFYSQLGFKSDPEGIKGMFFYPR